jgi:hypothetical protein
MDRYDSCSNGGAFGARNKLCSAKIPLSKKARKKEKKLTVDDIFKVSHDWELKAMMMELIGYISEWPVDNKKITAQIDRMIEYVENDKLRSKKEKKAIIAAMLRLVVGYSVARAMLGMLGSVVKKIDGPAKSTSEYKRCIA